METSCQCQIWSWSCSIFNLKEIHTKYGSCKDLSLNFDKYLVSEMSQQPENLFITTNKDLRNMKNKIWTFDAPIKIWKNPA